MRADWTPAERELSAELVCLVIELRMGADRAAAFHLHTVGLVSRLRGAGVSWALIGEALGISRQAAQQRFGSSL